MILSNIVNIAIATIVIVKKALSLSTIIYAKYIHKAQRMLSSDGELVKRGIRNTE